MNRLLAEAVAARGLDARLVDLSAIVCPGGHFTSELGGVPLRLDDGVHFDVRGTPLVWEALLPDVLDAANNRSARPQPLVPSEPHRAEGVSRAVDERREVGVRHLELRHLFAEVVDDTVGILVAQSALHLAVERASSSLLSAPSSAASMAPRKGERGVLPTAPASWASVRVLAGGAVVRLAVAVTSPVDSPRWRHRIAALGLAVALLAGACSDDGGATGDAVVDDGPNSLPPPTLPGGVELAAVDPHRLLVGEGLAYGRPLPSEQAAADAYLEDPEVAAVVARRLHSRGDGRLVGEVLLLEVDGAEIFDGAVLDAFVDGAVGRWATAPPRR